MRTRSFFSAVLLVVLFVELAFPIEAVQRTGNTDASSHEALNKNASLLKKLSSSEQEFSAVVETPSSSSKDRNEEATNQAVTYEVISKSMVKQKPANQTHVVVFKECDDEDDCEPSHSSGDGDGNDGDKQKNDDKENLPPKDSFTTGDLSSRSSNRDDVGDPFETTYELISKSIMEPRKPLSSEECDDEDNCKSSSTGSGSGEIDNNGAVTSYTSNEKYDFIVGGFLPSNDEKHPIPKDFFSAEDSRGESPSTNNGGKTYELILKSEMIVKNAMNVEDCDDEDDCEPNFSGDGEEDFKTIRGLSPPKDEMSANPSTVPFFLGTSFLIFPPLGQKAQEYLKAEMTIKPLDKSGLLFYNGWDRQTIGDFISLALRNGYVELSFNCGSGLIRIRSTKAVTMNKWTKIKFYRSGRLGSLTVNTDSPSLGFSPGPRTKMFLHQNLSIGGVPDNLKQEVEINVDVSRGFTGYIRDVRIKGNVINLMSHAIAGNIANEKVHGCPELPCKNGGTCVAHGQRYSCECTTDYRGQYCEKEINQAMTFHRDSYIYFKKSALLKILKGRDGAVTFSMKTTQVEGLIIWETQQVDEHSKRFVTVSLKAGYISLSFDIGFGEYLLYSTVPVNDGQWHTVAIERTVGSAALVIDEIHRTEFKPVAFFQSEKNVDLYIGGVPDIIKKTKDMHHSGFDGCMGKFKIKKEYLDLVYDAFTVKNTGHCVHN